MRVWIPTTEADGQCDLELGTRLRTARLGVIVASVLLVLAGGAGPAVGESHAAMPPGIDPGTPSYAASSVPLPAEPVRFDPRRSPLGAIFDADAARGGTSYWIDRVLERPFRSANDTALYTRGRALYMYTHDPATLGFAGGYAYRERPTGRNQDMYTVALSDTTLTEDTAARKQYPSHWASTLHCRRPAGRREEVHHLQQRRRHGAGAHQYGRRADHPDGDRGLADRDHPGGGRHRAHGLGDGALRPHRRHPAAERQRDRPPVGRPSRAPSRSIRASRRPSRCRWA